MNRIGHQYRDHADWSGSVLNTALIVINVILGISGALRLTGMLSPVPAAAGRRWLAFLVCLGAYFLECVALAFGMGTQVFALVLAVLWGYLLGRRLTRLAQTGPTWRIPLAVGFFTSSPTLSLSLLLPLASYLEGRDILSAQAGIEFGIPGFLPDPFRTILGFCPLLGLGTLLLKCAITIAVAGRVARRVAARPRPI